MKRFFSKIAQHLPTIKRLPDDALEPPTVSSISERQKAWDQKLVFSLAKKRFPTWQQLQYLPRYLTPKERITIRVLLGLLIVSLGFLVVGFYQRHVAYLPKQGGTYSEALVGQPTYVNPVLAQTDVDRDVSRLVYSGLFKINEQLQVVPDLAERYEISEDKKTYTVHLRPNLFWQNGNALLADDIVYTYETVMDPDYKSPYYASFRGMAVARVDDQTVTFTLPTPFAPFLTNLTLGILPSHLWSDVAPETFPLAEYNTKPVGSGPYLFKELIKDRDGTIKSYTFERNPHYAGDHTPYLDRIILKFYESFAAAVNAAKSGATEGVSYIPKDLRPSLSKNTDLTIYPLQLPQYTAVFFNQKNALLKNNNINKALSLATDKARILTEALGGQGRIIDGPILEGFLGYYPDIEKFGYDPTRAADVLDEQGWKIPEGGGLRQKSGSELRFSLTTVDQTEYLKTADILKENWEALGIGIELKIMNPNRIDKEVIKPRSYEAFLYGEILGSDPDPYPFWHSSQATTGLNLPNYYNKEVDKLLESARQTASADERAKQYVEFQKLLIADMPALFLYSPSYDYGVNEKVHGITGLTITAPSDRFNWITSWYVKTRLGWK